MLGVLSRSCLRSRNPDEPVFLVRKSAKSPDEHVLSTLQENDDGGVKYGHYKMANIGGGCRLDISGNPPTFKNVEALLVHYTVPRAPMPSHCCRIRPMGRRGLSACMCPLLLSAPRSCRSRQRWRAHHPPSVHNHPAATCRSRRSQVQVATWLLTMCHRSPKAYHPPAIRRRSSYLHPTTCCSVRCDLRR